jgi:hypothetical protein
VRDSFARVHMLPPSSAPIRLADRVRIGHGDIAGHAQI